MNTTLTSAIFTPDRIDKGLVAFSDESGGGLTYGDASALVARIAIALRDIGIGGVDRVAFLVPRGPLGALGFLAISKVAMCCPLNRRLRTDELARTIAAMGITAVVASQADADALPPAARGLPTLMVEGDDATTLALIPRHRRAARPDSDAPPSIALLMQTSGTTSAPKEVELTHANILSAATAIRNAFSLGEADLCLNPMPLHHVHGLISASLSSLVSGSRVLCSDGFSAAGFEKLMAAFAPTWFTASPAMHLALLEHFTVAGRRPAQDSLRFFRSSSAPLPASAIAALEAVFGAPLIETYGLTETASMICSNPLPPGRRKLGSVGIAFGSEIRIADADGRDRAAEEVGEIVVRGPSVIRQYGGGRGADTFFGDWLRTGDLGHLDMDGYLFIVGRTKELIKRGGLSVYPAEVDNALMSHPDVAEAVAFSVPHPTLGEELVAAVVPRAGARPSDAALRAYLALQLSGYKVPTVIQVIDAIPKSETGKIVRRGVAESLAGLLAPKGVAPATPQERLLLAAWQEVLGRADFGVTDNVFLMGGDPLRAERIADRLRASGGSAPSVKALLSAPSVREQAGLLIPVVEGAR